MELKIVETSLNLRVERRLGKQNRDYLLSKDVAEEQLKLGADVYCNVEYMECQDKKYMEAFKNAGYCLKDMVDMDVASHVEDYPRVEKPDPNIDFRRVKNLRVYFEKYAISLTTDINQIEEWQAGDIVIFGADKHIGIVSDKRNKDGQPYILHNGGQPNREEDYLHRSEVTGHYRFDASLVDEEKLIKWHE